MKKSKHFFKADVEKAKKSFPSHCLIRLRIKQNPVNPYTSITMEKIIGMRKLHPEYVFYIHERDNYVRYSCPTIENFESVKLPLDDKLWVELFSIFDFVGKVEND